MEEEATGTGPVPSVLAFPKATSLLLIAGTQSLRCQSGGLVFERQREGPHLDPIRLREVPQRCSSSDWKALHASTKQLPSLLGQLWADSS